MGKRLLNFRVDEDYFRRADALRPWLGRQSRIQTAILGGVSRSHVLRVAIDIGLTQLETEAGILLDPDPTLPGVPEGSPELLEADDLDEDEPTEERDIHGVVVDNTTNDGEAKDE